jgi:hypothetical protein
MSASQNNTEAFCRIAFWTIAMAKAAPVLAEHSNERFAENGVRTPDP